jgi:hypothetical protein
MVLERNEEPDSLLLAPLRLNRLYVEAFAAKLDPEGTIWVALAGVGADAELEGAEASELAGRDGISHLSSSSRIRKVTRFSSIALCTCFWKFVRGKRPVLTSTKAISLISPSQMPSNTT